MQQVTPIKMARALFLSFVLSILAFAAFAQDSTGTTTTHSSSTTTTTQSWYMEPWAWIVGAIVLVILLISLFRGSSSGKTDSVTYTKTVKRDEDV